MKKSKAIRAREIIVKAMDGTIDDTEALEVPNLFNFWSGDSYSYKANTRVRYENSLYRCIMDHTSQPTWNPIDAPSLWAKVLIPDANVIPEWEQPDSTNGYQYGDKVTHNGKTWISIFNGSNVWEPGAVGTEALWEEVVEDDNTSDTPSDEGSGETDPKDPENPGQGGNENPKVEPDPEPGEGVPEEESVPAWVQPDSTNGYSVGDKVTHNGFTWTSKLDNNVYEPSDVAWAAWEKNV